MIPFPTWRFKNIDAVKFSLNSGSPKQFVSQVLWVSGKWLRWAFDPFDSDVLESLNLSCSNSSVLGHLGVRHRQHCLGCGCVFPRHWECWLSRAVGRWVQGWTPRWLLEQRRKALTSRDEQASLHCQVWQMYREGDWPSTSKKGLFFKLINFEIQVMQTCFLLYMALSLSFPTAC